MTFQVKMIPGQKPYTDEELEKLYRIVHEAAAGDPGEDGEDEVLRKYKEREPKRYPRRNNVSRRLDVVADSDGGTSISDGSRTVHQPRTFDLGFGMEKRGLIKTRGHSNLF